VVVDIDDAPGWMNHSDECSTVVLQAVSAIG
jgi:hypothetical protein